jgi:hypothetical protein
MTEQPDEDSPTIGERMNRALYLDPGFTVEHPSLIDALHEDQDETVVRAQAALDERRAREAADAAEAGGDAEPSTDQA